MSDKSDLIIFVLAFCLNLSFLCLCVTALQAGQAVISPEQLQQALGPEHIIVAQEQPLSDQVLPFFLYFYVTLMCSFNERKIIIINAY